LLIRRFYDYDQMCFERCVSLLLNNKSRRKLNLLLEEGKMTKVVKPSSGDGRLLHHQRIILSLIFFSFGSAEEQSSSFTSDMQSEGDAA
jgi:hypothetical protein